MTKFTLEEDTRNPPPENGAFKILCSHLLFLNAQDSFPKFDGEAPWGNPLKIALTLTAHLINWDMKDHCTVAWAYLNPYQEEDRGMIIVHEATKGSCVFGYLFDSKPKIWKSNVRLEQVPTR